MLYLNGVRFNTKSNDPDYIHKDLVTAYRDTIKEAREKYGDYMVLETRQRPFPDPKTNYMVFPGTRGLLLRTTRIDDAGNTEEWIYSESSLGKRDGSDELDLKMPNLLIEKGQMPIEIKRNPDLVFYALWSGKVGKTEAEGKKFHIKDDAARSHANVAQRKIESRVSYMIYSALSEKNLLILAKSWGISGVKDKHPDEVRELLHSKVERGEKGKINGAAGQRGYQEFLESADVKANDRVAALCVDAEDKGYLVYDVEHRSWYLNYKDGAMPFRIKELGSGEFTDPLGSLVQYLIFAPESLHKVENLMNRGPIEINDRPVPTDSHDITMEVVQAETNVQKLKKMIRTIDSGYEIPNTMKSSEAKEILFGLLAATAE